MLAEKKYLEMNGDILTVLEGFKDDIEDGGSRSQSWELCYEFFHANERNQISKDLACLNLGFYLASWGMYRGSSFLLQKSCLIFEPIIDEMLKAEYNSLWEISDAVVINSDTKKIWEKIEKLKNFIYKNLRSMAEDEARKTGKKTSQPTDTLMTKILLGTMGCIPGYDTYFIKGLKDKKLKSEFKQNKFNCDSFAELINFYKNNDGEFKKVNFKTAKNHLPYPPMKNLDLYIWAKGRGK